METWNTEGPCSILAFGRAPNEGFFSVRGIIALWHLDVTLPILIFRWWFAISFGLPKILSTHINQQQQKKVPFQVMKSNISLSSNKSGNVSPIVNLSKRWAKWGSVCVCMCMQKLIIFTTCTLFQTSDNPMDYNSFVSIPSQNLALLCHWRELFIQEVRQISLLARQTTLILHIFMCIILQITRQRKKEEKHHYPRRIWVQNFKSTEFWYCKLFSKEISIWNLEILWNFSI